MVNAKFGIKAILGTMFGLLLLVFGWYLLPAFASFFEINLLKGMFWIGAVLLVAINLAIKPYFMAQGGSLGWKNSVMGTLSFFVGCIISLVLYWSVPPLIEVGQTLFNSAALSGIAWFGLIIMWALLLIIGPTYISVKDSMN